VTPSLLGGAGQGSIDIPVAAAGEQWDDVFDWTVLKYEQAQITSPPLDATEVQATAAGIPSPRRLTTKEANQTIRSVEGSRTIPPSHRDNTGQEG